MCVKETSFIDEELEYNSQMLIQLLMLRWRHIRWAVKRASRKDSKGAVRAVIHGNACKSVSRRRCCPVAVHIDNQRRPGVWLIWRLFARYLPIVSKFVRWLSRPCFYRPEHQYIRFSGCQRTGTQAVMIIPPLLMHPSFTVPMPPRWQP